MKWMDDGGTVDVSYILTILKTMLRPSIWTEHRSPKRRRSSHCTYCWLPVHEPRCSRPCQRIACCDIPCSGGPTIWASCTPQKLAPPSSWTRRETLQQEVAATRALLLLPTLAQGQRSQRRTEPSGNEASRIFGWWRFRAKLDRTSCQVDFTT